MKSIFSIRLDEKTKKKLKESAGKIGVGVGTYIRMIILEKIGDGK